MEIRSVTAAFVALCLIYYAERCSGVVQIVVPDSGTVIEGFAGDGNVSFFCEVLLPSGEEQATTWSIQQETDSSPRAIALENNLNIDITGDPIPGFLNFTFNTNLTITVLTVELHNSTLFCGTQGNLEAANFTILVFEVPTRPLALAVNDTDEDSFVITWQPPETIGSPPTSVYELVLSPDDNPEAQNVSINISAPTTTVEIDATELFPQTTYLATVTAISEMFVSPPSLSINFTTSTSVPRLECNSAPTLQDSTIRFTPTLVHTGGLNLTNHTVEVQPINSENFTTVDQEVFVSIVNSQITDFVINNTFEAGSTFTFRVSSSNSLGFSDPVECPPLNLTIGIPTVPSTPTGESTDPDTIRLTLSTAEAGVPDPPHSFRFNIRVFQLFLNDSSKNTTLIGDFTQTYPGYVDGSSEIFDASGLVADEQFANGSIVMYVADVRAINDVGESAFSNLSEPITVELTVPVIDEVRIQITATQIIVRWVFDHTGGVAVTEVLVELRTGNSQEYEVAPGGNLTDSESSETMLSIPGGEFLAGVEYQFRVTATNVIGPSLETESVTTAAPIGIPGTPDVPIVISSRGCRVVLELRTSEPGVIDPPHSFRFVVRVCPLSTNDNFTVAMEFPRYMSGERVSFTVEDLVIGEQYQFAAQAYNGFGFSEFSNDSNIVTVTEDTGLSDGAVAGIVIGAVVGVVLLIVVVVLIIVCCIKRKQQKDPNKNKTGSSEELGLQYSTAYEKEKPTDETAFSATDQPESDTTNTYEAIAEKQQRQQEQLEAEQQQDAPVLYDTLAAVNDQMTDDPDIDDPPQAKTSDNPLYSGVGESTDALIAKPKDDPVYQEAP